MQINLADTAFMSAIKRVTASDRPGRPQGATDKQRQKNSRYYWNEADMRAKFLARVDIEHDWTTPIRTGDCWIWTGATTRGFGYIVWGSRQDNGGKSPRIQAHRLAYLLYVGSLKPGDLVGQRCGRKLCVNPDHLYTWRR